MQTPVEGRALDRDRLTLLKFGAFAGIFCYTPVTVRVKKYAGTNYIIVTFEAKKFGYCFLHIRLLLFCIFCNQLQHLFR